MATNPMIAMSSAESMLNTLCALFNSGSIKIYTGSPPADLEDSATGTLLSSGCTFSATAFGNATDGGSGSATASANSIAADTNCAASGTAGYFRACNSGATALLQGTVGTSSADMILSSTSVTASGTLTITAFTVTLPDGSGVD
jgi:hypothetical protein